jgi:hypothetical protein
MPTFGQRVILVGLKSLALGVRRSFTPKMGMCLWRTIHETFRKTRNFLPDAFRFANGMREFLLMLSEI